MSTSDTGKGKPGRGVDRHFLFTGSAESIVLSGNTHNLARVRSSIRNSEFINVEQLIFLFVDEEITCALDFCLLIGVVDT